MIVLSFTCLIRIERPRYFAACGSRSEQGHDVERKRSIMKWKT